MSENSQRVEIQNYKRQDHKTSVKYNAHVLGRGGKGRRKQPLTSPT
jgi:hypothetical protein